MTRNGIHLFTWSGSRTFLHPTFFILPAFFVLPDLIAGDTDGAMTAAWLIFVSFSSILLHEYGHIFMARHRGIPTGDIYLHFFGGVANLGPDMGRGRNEVLVALAGPAVNVVLAGLSAAGAAALKMAGMGGSLGYEAAFGFCMVNLIIMGFNLMPLFPMDGGRVLRGSLWGLLGRRRATMIAVVIGWLVALGVAVAAVILGQYLLIALVLIMVLAGLAELKAAGGFQWHEERKTNRIEPTLSRPAGRSDANA